MCEKKCEKCGVIMQGIHVCGPLGKQATVTMGGEMEVWKPTTELRFDRRVTAYRSILQQKWANVVTPYQEEWRDIPSDNYTEKEKE